MDVDDWPREVLRLLGVDPHEQPIGAVRGRIRDVFSGDRHAARALLARAFCNQLLNPQTKRFELRWNEQCQLVASGARARANGQTERGGRIRGRGAEARLRRGEHRDAPPDDGGNVEAHEGGRHEAEERHGRIAAADVGRVDEEIAKAFSARAVREVSPFIRNGDETVSPPPYARLFEPLTEM